MDDDATDVTPATDNQRAQLAALVQQPNQVVAPSEERVAAPSEERSSGHHNKGRGRGNNRNKVLAVI